MRAAAAFGLIEQAPVQFEKSNSVCNAGVLLLLPALLSQGLLKSGERIYNPLHKGYYGLQHILLLLAFMVLCRIKSPEQLKKCKPGELGKIMGLDRVPEVRCLRMKIDEIVKQGKAKEYNLSLAKEWMAEDQCVFFYIDGHVKVYSGEKANLPKKFVSRQKLCLAGMTEFWVNDEIGMPYFMVIGEINEKLADALLNQIVPTLLKEATHLPSEAELENNMQLPRFTLVFDREGYDAKLFSELWNKYRIAVITYRKNVKDKWIEKDFTPHKTKVIKRELTMNICEKKTEIGGMLCREIRKLSDGGHQTSIVTTNFLLDKAIVAGKMFSRWSQENFFKYAIEDFDLDRLAQYGVQEANPDLIVVNPLYRKTSYQLKKAKEKQSRLKAKQMKIVNKNLDQNMDHLKKELEKQAKLHDDIQNYQKEIERLTLERKQLKSHIALKEMQVDEKYQNLKTESKLFMNTIKMIAFRAETAVSGLLSPFYKREKEEIRMLIKEIINTDADILPNYENNTITIKLHSLSTPRANEAADNLCLLLNDTETIYPGTKLRIIFQSL